MLVSATSPDSDLSLILGDSTSLSEEGGDTKVLVSIFF